MDDRPLSTGLRIVTINTGKCDGSYRARLRWLASELSRLVPDIIALQEAPSSPRMARRTRPVMSPPC